MAATSRSGFRRRERDDAAAALVALGGLARAHHYDTVQRVHCFEHAPRWLDASVRQTLASCPQPTRDLVRLFFLGERLPAVRVARLCGEGLAAALLEAGLLDDGPAGTAARYRLEVVGDHLLLVEWPGGRASGVYFGEDSQFLRHVVRPRRGDRCLDLCTGTGVQALRCAAVAAHVDAVDLDPAAVRLARWNAVLNDLDDRVRVHEGDLWGALPPGTRYDHVVCNPPLVPVPEAVPYPLCGHGGADGLELVGRILAALPGRLAPGGRCTMIGACTGTVGAPAVLDALEPSVAAGMGVTVFLLLRMTLRDWVRTLTESVVAIYPGASAGNTVLRCRTRYGSAFDDTVVYTYLVVVDRDAEPGRRVFDYSGVGQRSYWFVNRGRIAP
jgi:methylase of polypeptide subunit release factors